MKLLVINGPNLNFLGIREKGIYGTDALASVEIPKIEVHISNVHKREEFRHTSVTAPACTGQVVGLGLKGYLLAMDYLTGRV